VYYFIEIEMNKIHSSYLAGIIDGEGTVSFMKRGRNFFPTVTIANTSRELLDWCGRTAGLPFTICVKQPRSLNHSLSYHIRWRFDAALELLRMCRPFFIVKREQADILLRWKIVVRRNGRYTSQELADRNSLVKMIRARNSRPAWKQAVENLL
jgi:hypothetical protein